MSSTPEPTGPQESHIVDAMGPITARDVEVVGVGCSGCQRAAVAGETGWVYVSYRRENPPGSAIAGVGGDDFYCPKCRGC